MSETYKYHPFAPEKNLSDEGGDWYGRYAIIYEAKRNPNLIVKDHGGSDPKLLQKHLKDLQTYVPGYIPETTICVAGKNNKDKHSYTISQRVTSVALEAEKQREFCDELDFLLAKSLEMFLHKLRQAPLNNHPYRNEVWATRAEMPDIRERNLKWGHTEKNIDNKLYLVDTGLTEETAERVYKTLIPELINPYLTSHPFIRTKEKLKDLYKFGTKF